MACGWQPVAAAPALRWQTISPAQRHSCRIDALGRTLCWGFGLGGQLGDGLSSNSSAPVLVAGGHRFVQVDAGRSSLLSCALDAAGSAWCWGVAILTGGGNEDTSKVPVAVSGSQRWRALSAGSTASCGITNGGQALCFGINSNGAVGQNNLGP